MSDTFFARLNQDNAKNDAINLEDGVDSILITFVPKDPNGDKVLEAGLDPDTQVSINGILYDFEYIVYGTLPTDGKVPQQFHGDPVAIIRVLDYPSDGQSERLVFLPEENATQQEMDAFQQGNITPIQLDVLPDTPVCFASGTLIETPDGPRLIDDLRQGDLIITVDDGPQPVVWMTSSRHVWPGSEEKFKPVEIKAGAFGDGLPRVTLLVSPQHHFLLADPNCYRLFGMPEVIAPAKGLVDLPGVRAMAGKKSVTYFHLMLAKHSLLIAGGVYSESFYPGPTAIKMLGDEKREELFALFPLLKTNPETGYGSPVRRKITRRETEELVALLNVGTNSKYQAA